jgi:predicted ABC-class ATPase
LFFLLLQSIEMGADTLLIDEDTCATNFMIRDNKMAQLVACEKEPITPFIRVVRSLKEQGVSTVLVVGGTGDFFDVADRVLLMDCYRCEDATARALQIVQNNGPAVPPSAPFALIRERFPVSSMFRSDGKVKVLARNVISYGDTEIDLSAVEQVISSKQTNAIAHALQRLASTGTQCNLLENLEAIERTIDDKGLDVLAPGQFNGSFMRPRLLEISAAVNRLRRDCIKQQ